MQTLGFSVVLLLLSTLYSCHAIPHAVRISTARADCCKAFWTKAIPKERISSVTQSHGSCSEPAFLIHTVRGKQICYRQSFQWAKHVNQLFNKPEATSAQH